MSNTYIAYIIIPSIYEHINLDSTIETKSLKETIMNKEQLEILNTLQAARDLITNPANWTQGNFATTKTNNPIGPGEKAACKLCALGAVIKVSKPVNSKCMFLLVDTLRMNTLFENIGDYNDASTHQEVLDLFDKTIVNFRKDPLFRQL